jgi:hypothetical protein
MEPASNSAFLIATVALLSGVLIARLTTASPLERLKSRHLLAAGVVYTFSLLSSLTYQDSAVGISLGMLSTATGFLLARRPYGRVRVELQVSTDATK